MPNIKNNASAKETCRKLIDAAGELFAERGLHATTIKDITDRAGVNMAAVNYHFRDKFELYTAVVRHALTTTAVIPLPGELSGTPEDRLRQVIRSQIEDIFDPSRPAWRGPLVAHEFAQPTEALDAVMEELIRPRSELVEGIVRDIVGPGVPERQVLSAVFSVGAQALFYLYHTGIIQRLHPDLPGKDSAEELANHIVEFSLPGLYAMRDKRKAKRRP
jgi:TetR/AcrR family transcriptional regulator, regulator of cefoperazone and chloramphenicol sensitivity